MRWFQQKWKRYTKQVVKSKDTGLLKDPPSNLFCASAEFLCSSWQLQGYFQELAGLIQKNGRGFKFVSNSREIVHMDQQLWLVICSGPLWIGTKLKQVLSSNHLELTKFDVKQDQSVLLSLSPNSFMKLYTWPLNICYGFN